MGRGGRGMIECKDCKYYTRDQFLASCSAQKMPILIVSPACEEHFELRISEIKRKCPKCENELTKMNDELFGEVNQCMPTGHYVELHEGWKKEGGQL
jgi:hypothetical protein